jgi:hypothetical protein
MSKYTQEELDSLLASGDAQKNENGSITWAVDNAYDKKPGTWLVRPPEAAPLITPEKGVELAILRKDKRRQAVEEGFALGIGDAINTALTTDEALTAFVALVAKTATDTGRKDFARLAQMLFEMMEATPEKKVEIDRRVQTIDMSGASVLIEGSPAIQRLLDNGD